MIGPCESILPGPELPLVDYWPDNVFRIGDVDVREMSAPIYRAIVRCYALELFPFEVTSYKQWRQLLIDIFDPAALNHGITRGARFRVQGSPLRYDPWAALKVDAQARRSISQFKNVRSGVYRIGCALWDSLFYTTHGPTPLFSADEMLLYRNKCIRVQIRLKSLGVTTMKNKKLARSMNNKLATPRISKAFTKPFPGAVVHVFGEPGWVIREVDNNAVVVEFEHGDEFEEEVILVDDLVVLG